MSIYLGQDVRLESKVSYTGIRIFIGCLVVQYSMSMCYAVLGYIDRKSSKGRGVGEGEMKRESEGGRGRRERTGQEIKRKGA